MARYWFGGGIPDFTLAMGDTVTVGALSGRVCVVVSATVTLWDAESGGDQYTDLLDEGGVATTSVVSADGSGERALGQIPRFQGPDAVTQMWAQAAEGPRALITTPVVGGTVSPDQLEDYLPLEAYTEKGALLVATGAGTPAVLEPGPNGSVPIYDSDEPSGMRPELVALFGNMLRWDGTTYVPAPLKADTSKPRMFVGPADPEGVAGVVMSTDDWADVWLGGS
ncbi:hypothetical protein I0C86_41520 [Plantactinospora sp. S1510]|uniref:Uncharacterized protein n=1 Tax=Plantactinospora alkalitolerans TaxID=2789879 RepID=A0ABS0HA22_9ACTN|nr:hypothetical protein [Plantactinospora alkalitolerans]MBF9135333.1 hypothetical protein [Plantactinospora alkalitolerans]